MAHGYANMGGGEYRLKQLQVLPVPDDLDFVKYSTLMGYLATNGASLQLGKNWFWDYSTVYLRLAHTSYEFLYWLVGELHHRPHFVFADKNFNRMSSSNSIQIGTIPSHMCYILWLHWNQVGIHLLPHHFEHYFSINTLASWAMRNGQRTGNVFMIHVSRLNDNEKALLISLIKDKLGYDSYLTMKGNKLSISSPDKLVKELTPFFHESQLYRLVKK
jgi:hypothetical protein